MDNAQLIIMAINNNALSEHQQAAIKPGLEFVLTVLGKLFVQDYRIITKEGEYMLLYRRSNSILEYLFVGIDKDTTISQIAAHSKKCLDRLKSYSPQKPASVTLLILTLWSRSTMLVRLDQPNKSEIEKYSIEVQEPEIAMEAEQQFLSLKKIINDYVDRVGQFKEFVLQEYLSAQKFMLSFDIRLLLQTVNFVLAQQCLKQSCTQIQSECWSRYSPMDAKWIGQRRDTIIKKKGNLIIVDWVFLHNIDKYIDQRCIQDTREMIIWYMKGYKDVRVLICCISNVPSESGVIYKHTSRMIGLPDIQFQLARIQRQREQLKEIEVIEILD